MASILWAPNGAARSEAQAWHWQSSGQTYADGRRELFHESAQVDTLECERRTQKDRQPEIDGHSKTWEDEQTDRQIDRQAERLTDRRTDRQSD